MEPSLPSLLGVPHPSWRPHQYESYERIRDSQHKFIFIEAPTGSGKCLALDTLVESGQGLLRISRMPSRVLSLSYDLNFYSAQVECQSFPELNKVLTLTTRKGYSLRGTREHKVLCFTGRHFRWTCLGNLSDDDFVVLSKLGMFPNEPESLWRDQEQPMQFTLEGDRRSISREGRAKTILSPEFLDCDWCYFLGLLVGDGYLGSHQRVVVVSADKEIEAFLFQFVERIGLYLCKADKPGKASAYSVTSLHLWDFLERVGLAHETAHHKRIPESIMSGTRRQMSSFLRGLFDADGTTTGGQVKFSTVSEELSRQVQLSLLRLGIVSNRVKRNHKGFGSPHVIYRVVISGLSSRRFAEVVGFGIARKMKLLEEYCSKPTSNRTHHEVIPNCYPLIQGAWGLFQCNHVGSSQKDLKELTGIAYDTFWYYLHGKNQIPQYRIRQLLPALAETESPASIMLAGLAYAPLFFDKVRNVIDSGEHLTTDLRVSSIQNFVANGFVVHNSAISTALGSTTKTTTLVSTLGLLDQYHREYDFTIIKGRASYPCADIDKIDEWRRFNIRPTAFDCHLENMYKCDFSFYCPYLQAKRQAQHAQRLAMTYKYAALSSWPKDRDGILVCDEGHATADEILDCSDFLLTEYHFRRYKISSPRHFFSWRVQELMIDELRERVNTYLLHLLDQTQDYKHKKDASPQDSANYRFHLRIEHVYNELFSPTSWFLDASPANFQLRPLDARPIARWLWGEKSKVVLMSATIGDPEPLALELGIEEYYSFSTPHLIPASRRPVHVIFTRRMTKANRDRNPNLYRTQAYAIANFIREEIPETWRGLILTTSYEKITQLKDFLASFGLSRRLWDGPADAHGVSHRIAAFIADPSQGIIAVDTMQGWGHGLDLRGDLGRFIVVAGVPYYNPSDPFDQARLKRPGGMRYARWTAYNSVVQACGRVTRGEKVNGEYMLNVAALADGSAISPTAKRYFPEWFNEAMEPERTPSC